MKENLKEQMEVRLGCADDLSFVYATWLRSYKHSSYYAKRIRDKVYFHFHHKILESLMRRPGIVFLVASLKGEANVIFGYLVAEERNAAVIVHFSYVKPTWRRLGVFTTLIEEANIHLDESFFTHWTLSTDWLVKKYPGLTYNPYLL